MIYAAKERPSIEERVQGFQAAFEKFEVPVSRRSALFEARSLTFDGGHEAALTVLKRQRIPTGVCCANDEMAAGVLRAAHQLGLSVPEDLSVVGFDDITMANYTDPPLTTVGVVKEHLGRRAMTRLLELVEGTDQEVKREVVPVRLIVRGSTAHPRQ